LLGFLYHKNKHAHSEGCVSLEELLWSGEWSSPSKSSFGEWRSLRFEAFEGATPKVAFLPRRDSCGEPRTPNTAFWDSRTKLPNTFEHIPIQGPVV